MCKDSNLLSALQFEHSAKSLNECGKMGGGWWKQSAKPPAWSLPTTNRRIGCPEIHATSQRGWLQKNDLEEFSDVLLKMPLLGLETLQGPTMSGLKSVVLETKKPKENVF